MSESERQRIEQLRERVEYHAYLYHVLDAPDVSDAEYDALVRELAALEVAHPEWASPDSPTQRVGGLPRDQFAKVQHRVPS